MKSFTLIEILISLAIFMFVLLAFQAFLSSIFASEFRAVAMKKLADDTRTGLEIMGREMRLAQIATDSSCVTHNANPNNKSFMINNDNTTMGTIDGATIDFIDFEGNCVEYSFGNNTLSKRPTKTGASQIFLGGNIQVTDANFHLTIGPNMQPRVTIRVKVSTNDPTKQGSVLSIPLQTTVSQRQVNLVP